MKKQIYAWLPVVALLAFAVALTMHVEQKHRNREQAASCPGGSVARLTGGECVRVTLANIR